MTMDEKENNEVDAKRLREILRALSGVNALLRQYNDANGNTLRYRQMCQEIETLGWDGILERYHPDNNVKDPGAMELFDLYRFVRKTMKGTGQ